MNSIIFDVEDEKHFSSRIQNFFSRYRISSIQKQCNAYKKQGFSVLQIVRYLFTLVFLNRSMFQNMQSKNAPEFRKDTAYRLKDADYIDWKRFTTMTSALIIKDTIAPLTSESRRNAFIVDDSVYERNRSKKVELLAKVYDHAHGCYLKGFRMLTLGWSDGVTYMPVNSCLLSSENAKSRINEAKKKRPNSIAAKSREMAQKKATEVVPELISAAKKAGIQAHYVLFDSWFSSPKVIRSIKELELDTVAMVKKSDTIRYRYQGQKLSCKSIYSLNRKRRGRSRYLLSVDVQIDAASEGEEVIPAKLVYVRNRSN